MDGSFVSCPAWLLNRLSNAGGSLSFHEYMDLVLNDPDHGIYGSGRLRIGREGDFATSPSLGIEFAELLAIQIVQWFKQLEKGCFDIPLSLVEFGPGEGDLTFNLIESLEKIYPEILDKVQFILVDINQAMIEKQKLKLSKKSKNKYQIVNSNLDIKKNESLIIKQVNQLI